jgi:outer membrane protein OmpA-like peptidoglycan-associated protein/tetratricopeptide (TPR) repeat protein
MKLLKSIILLSIFTTAVHAQFVTSNKRIADVYFQNKEYYAAAEYYKKALQISGDSLSGFVAPYGFGNKINDAGGSKKEDYEYNVFQLANSLRLYNNFKDAEQWYAIARDFSAPEYKLSQFWYAKCLRANEKFSEAISAFNAFLDQYKANDGYPAMAKTELASCRFALYELQYPRMFTLTRLNNEVNDKGSNYAAYLSDSNSIYFTSSRPIGQPGKTEVLEAEDKKAKVAKKETPFLNSIYLASGNPLSEQVTVQRIGANAKGIETAAAALHPNGRAMYFTRWNNKEDKQNRQIYVAMLSGDHWAEPMPLGTQVNTQGFSAIQPFVTRDGKYLVFSSDRPGGQGKYDLWYSSLAADGMPGPAVNMGPSINTVEDEQAPYYNPITKKLLYSSNGKVGMGGFDFFESDGDFSNWADPVNPGYPLNSSKDDMYFTSLDSLDRTGYISSDRASLCCLEIFHVQRKSLTIQGTLLDCHTQKPMEGAQIVLSDSTGKKELITDASGRYSFKVNSNRKIKLAASKDGYFTKVMTYGYDQLAKSDTLFNPQLCLQPFEIDKPIVLENVLYEFDSDKLTEASKLILNNLYSIMVDNMTIEIELSAHTDNIGTPLYNLDLSQRRAKSCVDYLTSQGISASRMTSKGYGLTKPVAPNQFPNGKDNPEGRQLNRRTEFKVTKK